MTTLFLTKETALQVILSKIEKLDNSKLESVLSDLTETGIFNFFIIEDVSKVSNPDEYFISSIEDFDNKDQF